MRFIIGICAVLLTYASHVSATQFAHYLPMSDSEYAQKRRLKPVLTMPYPGDITPDQHWSFPRMGVSGATLTPDGKAESEKWRFIGKDRAGKPWSVPVGMLYNAGGQAEIYRADLDRNGVQDIIVWRANPGLGLAPTANLALITFKTDGRPCLFEPWGFYTTSKTGVDDLLDLAHNGRAQLLDMQFSDGYWITDLYRVKEARWQRVHGGFGQLRYPALSRFTDRPNRKLLTKPIAGRHPETDDLSAQQHCL